MNNTDADQKTILLNVQVILLAVFIVFTGFAKVAHAQLSNEECDKRHGDFLMSALPATGEVSNFNIAQYLIKLNVASYRKYLGIEALFQGECSHTPSAIDYVNEAKKRLQEIGERCQSNGQGSNCGVGRVATNSQHNNIQTQTNQSPTATEELADDPKVFGGSSSPLPTKTKKKKK